MERENHFARLPTVAWTDMSLLLLLIDVSTTEKISYIRLSAQKKWKDKIWAITSPQYGFSGRKLQYYWKSKPPQTLKRAEQLSSFQLKVSVGPPESAVKMLPLQVHADLAQNLQMQAQAGAGLAASTGPSTQAWPSRIWTLRLRLWGELAPLPSTL